MLRQFAAGSPLDHLRQRAKLDIGEHFASSTMSARGCGLVLKLATIAPFAYD
jgi:hypothetical protein